MSHHPATVVRLNRFEKHPNADRLKIARVNGFTVCVGLDQFREGDLAVYIEPESVCPDSPEFAFLGEKKRIKVRKMRGVVSMGLLIPAPEGVREWEDVSERLGIVHYEPPPKMVMGGEDINPPPGYRPQYDVENIRRYLHLFTPGEPVHVSEKVHGSGARVAWSEGELFVGSRKTWKKEDLDLPWWRAVRRYPQIEQFCRDHPEITVYGEVYGWVQDLRYGAKKNEVFFAVFDLLRNGTWIDAEEARELSGDLPWVPELGRNVPFDFDLLCELAEGDTRTPNADCIREGIVIKPMKERISPEIGRVCLKLVSNRYLETH